MVAITPILQTIEISPPTPPTRRPADPAGRRHGHHPVEHDRTQRLVAGCADRNVASDLTTTAAAVVARSSSTTVNVCVCAENETGTVAEISYCILQSPATLALAGGATSTVDACVFESFVTESAGADPRITMQLGVGSAGSDPRTTIGNNDEYDGVVTAPSIANTCSCTTRVTRDGINWTYCDLDATGSNPGCDFSTTQLTLTVH